MTNTFIKLSNNIKINNSTSNITNTSFEKKFILNFKDLFNELKNNNYEFNNNYKTNINKIVEDLNKYNDQLSNLKTNNQKIKFRKNFKNLINPISEFIIKYIKKI